MVGYNSDDNALTLGDSDSLKVGDYEVEYNATNDEFQARYGRPIGGEVGNHGEIKEFSYLNGSRNGVIANNTNALIDTGYKTGNLGSNATFIANLKLNSTTETSHIIGTVASQSNQIVLTYNYQGTGFEISIQENNTLETAAVGTETDTNEHIVAGVVDTNELRIYVDGTLETTVTRSVGIIDSILSIGSRYNTTFTPDEVADGAINGELYRGRVYNRALSDTEISDISTGTEVTNGLEIDYQFQYPETPDVAIDSTGDAFPKNSIPRSTSGSLVPQGLAESVSAGEALADDGNTYTSVQTAVNNASGWVFVGPGTFNESVTISTAGLTLEGSGYGSVVNGGASDVITVSASNVTIQNIRVSDGGDGIRVNGENCTIDSILADESTNNMGIGVAIESTDCTVRNSKFINATYGVRASNYNNISNRAIVIGCYSVGAFRAFEFDNECHDSVMANCIAENASNHNLRFFGNADCIMIGNRSIGAGDHGIQLAGTDNIVANNRVSDSTNADIDTINATGAVLDGNLTGPSN